MNRVENAKAIANTGGYIVVPWKFTPKKISQKNNNVTDTIQVGL